MKNFEENLARLEKLSESIKKPDISLEDALKSFEEGIKIARKLEKDIEKMEGKIQILMNAPALDSNDTAVSDTLPELSLFTGADEATGTSGAPEQGTRQ